MDSLCVMYLAILKFLIFYAIYFGLIFTILRTNINEWMNERRKKSNERMHAYCGNHTLHYYDGVESLQTLSTEGHCDSDFKLNPIGLKSYYFIDIFLQNYFINMFSYLVIYSRKRRNYLIRLFTTFYINKHCIK